MKNFRFLFVVFCFLFFVLAFAGSARAATLFLAPSMGTYSVGATFDVGVKVNTDGKSINTAEATLTFDPTKIEISKISKTGSIFSLWVSEPTFSNTDGVITFAGGKPSPGYTGSSGSLITVTFKGLTAGGTNINFSSASVLADDGLGTNILSSLISGAYTITTKEITTTPPPTTPVTPTAPSGTPSAPVIISLTHSEEDKWYSHNDPEFSWQLPSGVTGVSVLLHQKATANPGSQSDGLITSKKFDDMEDGIWYFHIKFQNQYGWSSIIHRKVLIDTHSPEFLEIQVDNKNDPTNPAPILHFKSSDALSGIEYYEIKVEETDSVQLSAASLTHNPYKLPVQSPGTPTILVRAADGAGNSTISTAQITIEPIGEAPLVTEYPKRLNAGDVLTLKGTSDYPENIINVFLKREGGETVTGSTETDGKGNWVYVHSKTLERDDYEAWVVAVDNRGAQSEPSEKAKITVSLPTLIKFGKIALDYLSIMITLIVLIIGAVAIAFYAWYRVSLWRKRVRKETKEVMESITRAFKALREEVEEQIELLDEKPGLTKAERKVRDKLKDALNISEEFISKEVKDVEKETE